MRRCGGFIDGYLGLKTDRMNRAAFDMRFLSKGPILSCLSVTVKLTKKARGTAHQKRLLGSIPEKRLKRVLRRSVIPISAQQNHLARNHHGLGPQLVEVNPRAHGTPCGVSAIPRNLLRTGSTDAVDQRYDQAAIHIEHA